MLICRYVSAIQVERNLAFDTIWHSVICEEYNMSFLKLNFAKEPCGVGKGKLREHVKENEGGGFGECTMRGEDSGKGYDLELWGYVQVDARARREQQGIKWLCSVLSE